MLHNLRHFRRCLIIVTIAALAFGGREGVNLCFMPDGEVHLERSHSPCCLAGERPATADESALHDERVEGQGCIDISLGGDAAKPHHATPVLLQAPLMSPLVPPIISRTGQTPSPPYLPDVTPPHLISLQSIVLLI